MCEVRIIEEGHHGDMETYNVFKDDYLSSDLSVSELKSKYGDAPYYRYRLMLIDEVGADRRNNPKYYSYVGRNNVWRVVKKIKGRLMFFGNYKTENDAKKVVEYLKTVNWDKKQLDLVKNFLGV